MRSEPAPRSSPFESASQESSDPRRLLIVEDDPAILALNAMLLRQAGFRVEVAPDGSAAWDLLIARKFDLLVTDHEMPGLSGLGLIERVRAFGLGMLVMIVSGSPDLGEPRDYPHLQISAILRKPMHFVELVPTVRRTLGEKSIVSASDQVVKTAGPGPDRFGQRGAGKLGCANFAPCDLVVENDE